MSNNLDYSKALFTSSYFSLTICSPFWLEAEDVAYKDVVTAMSNRGRVSADFVDSSDSVIGGEECNHLHCRVGVVERIFADGDCLLVLGSFEVADLI